jgi:meiotically up-regulated gene 157 (Mug157) protein
MQVEDFLSKTLPIITSPKLATLFANTLPNTLDTTVITVPRPLGMGGADETFVVTGDIEAMWLRDSANQVSAHAG